MFKYQNRESKGLWVKIILLDGVSSRSYYQTELGIAGKRHYYVGYLIQEICSHDDRWTNFTFRGLKLYI